MTNNSDNFKFWCPVEIEKAIDETTGAEIMRLGGIASTVDEDSDGEFLDPKGFDIAPLIESGMVNWHHQAKTSPATIVGEPSKAEVRKEGLYIETDLYPSSSIARDIWELAQTLEKDSKTRRLGYSIEGKVVKRKSNDKKSPDYKKIIKAIITGVAITHQPKNPKTFANIIKGEIDGSFDEEEEKSEIEEKSLSTENASALKKESVDRKVKITTFSKSEVMDRLFVDIPSIDIEKAEKIYLMLTKIANMAKRKRVNEEDMRKAYDALGLSVEANEETVEKAENPEMDDDVEEEEETKPMKKAKPVKKAVPVVPEEDEDEEEDDEEVEEAKKGKMKKAQSGNLYGRFDRLEKAIASSHNNNASFIKALAVMVKSQSQELEKAMGVINKSNATLDEVLEINKAQEETISMLSEKLEEYGSGVPAPKAVRHAAPVERSFAKGEDVDIEKGGSAKNSDGKVSIKNRPLISEILDQATFSKGYDEEFSKACTHFEASKDLPANIISRIKNEFGIEIVR